MTKITLFNHQILENFWIKSFCPSVKGYPRGYPTFLFWFFSRAAANWFEPIFDEVQNQLWISFQRMWPEIRKTFYYLSHRIGNLTTFLYHIFSTIFEQDQLAFYQKSVLSACFLFSPSLMSNFPFMLMFEKFYEKLILGSF